MYWLDYSAAKLAGATIKAAGYGGVIRYIDAPDRLRTKHTSKAEYDSHIAAGLHVWLVMQNTTTDADGGWAMGVTNANRALAGAKMLGYTGPIFFTNDRTTVPNVAAWRGYLDGAASVLGIDRVGAYGFANAIELAVGHATYFWQSGRRTDLRPHSHLWQDNNTQVTVGGITCDRNLVLKEITEGFVGTIDDVAAGVAKYMKDAQRDLPEGGTGKRNLEDTEFQIAVWQVEILDRLRRIETTLSDDEASIIAAVRAQAQGAVDVADLSARLATSLGPALAAELGRRLLEGNPA